VSRQFTLSLPRMNRMIRIDCSAHCAQIDWTAHCAQGDRLHTHSGARLQSLRYPKIAAPSASTNARSTTLAALKGVCFVATFKNKAVIVVGEDYSLNSNDVREAAFGLATTLPLRELSSAYTNFLTGP
jgi:hypothetical protein